MKSGCAHWTYWTPCRADTCILNPLSYGYTGSERTENFCTVDTYLERTKHFVFWTRALRIYRLTLHCAYLSSDTTENFVLCTRAFGTYRSFRTVCVCVCVCIHNILNALSYMFVSVFEQNILNTYSCGYIRSQYPVIDSLSRMYSTCIQNVLNIPYSEYMHL